ncbi:MAG: FkbM family methyltransferase, partial [Acidobacteria bacterium]|nr:FkbM family methyltransferase [Acidobacteriota bacterium]
MQSILRKTGSILFGRVLPRLAYPVVTGPLAGARFVLGSLSGDGGGGSVYFNLVEPEQTAAMLREIKPGHVFFDIGANVGYYSILASRLIGKSGAVISCEPVVRNLALLQRHFEINHASNIRVLPFAVSDKNAMEKFSPGPDTSMGHLAAGSGSGDDVLVPTITLDTIAAEFGISPDVVKIDVEGAEMLVLR